MLSLDNYFSEKDRYYPIVGDSVKKEEISFSRMENLFQMLAIISCIINIIFVGVVLTLILYLKKLRLREKYLQRFCQKSLANEECFRSLNAKDAAAIAIQREKIFKSTTMLAAKLSVRIGDAVQLDGAMMNRTDLD